jgi:ATP-dependent Lhr-like helicase
MVYRNYFGDQKPMRKLQFSTEVIFNVLAQHEPDHVLLREAERDAVESFLDLAAAEAFLRGLKEKPIRLRRPAQLPPLAFAMYAATIKEALLVEDPAEMLERLYHHWWERLQPAHGPA